jgi:hypothetical protein
VQRWFLDLVARYRWLRDETMSKLAEWSKFPFLPLLAKCVVVISLCSLIVFAILYPARKREADAYSIASACAPAVKDSSACRLVADAKFIQFDCHNNASPKADDFCEMQLDVLGITRFIGVDRQRAESLAPGAHVRVELFRTLPTQVEFAGRFIEARGSAREAMRMLKLTLAIGTSLGLVAGTYLCLRRRHL